MQNLEEMGSIRRICVFGATGMLGRPVTQALVDAGFEVSAMVRNPQKAQKILPAKVTLLKGDLRSPGSIRKALKEVDAIYLNLSVRPDEKQKEFHTEVQGLDNILEEADKLNIQRIGYLSSIVQRYRGFDWWVFDIKRSAVQVIQQSGIPWTIFYPSTFMETLSERSRSGNRILISSPAQVSNYFIAGADYGRQVAKAFSLAEASNQHYDIQGPEALTLPNAAQRFVESYAKSSLKISDMSLKTLRFFGKFIRQMDYGAHILEAMLNYEEPFTSQNTWDLLGAPTTRIEDFGKNL